MKVKRTMKKIAVVGEEAEDTLAWHIHYTLEKMSYQAKIFEPSGGLEKYFISAQNRFYLSRISQKYEEHIFKNLSRQIIDYEPTLVIVILRNIPPYVIDSIKKASNVKIVFWTGDGMVNLQRQYALISKYDAWFVKDRYMYDFMRSKLRLNVHLLPECCNPYVQKPPSKTAFGSKYDVSVVGTLYPYRANILDQLIADDITVDIFGAMPNWIGAKWKQRHAHQYVVLDKKNEVFYGSKINLNTIFYGDIDAGNCRLFEVAGAGGFQICDRKEAIKNYFVEDEEIVFFDTADELIKKIKYYLEHQDEAEAIAKRGHERALKEHRYEDRINKIFEIIGFDR